MYSEMLERGMVSDPERKKSYLHTLRTESERLEHLVENVLAYARLESGKARRRMRSMSVGELTSRAVESAGARVEQAGMSLVPRIPDNVRDMTVRADAAAVEQILYNLVDNACKYAAHAKDRRIHLNACATDLDITISVCDHGPGVPPGEAPRLFKAFTKSAADAANSAPGVGLGLALSRRLARRLGGELTVSTDNEDGACFVLRIPRYAS